MSNQIGNQDKSETRSLNFRPSAKIATFKIFFKKKTMTKNCKSWSMGFDFPIFLSSFFQIDHIFVGKIKD